MLLETETLEDLEDDLEDDYEDLEELALGEAAFEELDGVAELGALEELAEAAAAAETEEERDEFLGAIVKGVGGLLGKAFGGRRRRRRRGGGMAGVLRRIVMTQRKQARQIAANRRLAMRALRAARARR